MKILYTFNPQRYWGLTLISITFWEMESLSQLPQEVAGKWALRLHGVLMSPKDILRNWGFSITSPSE